MHIPLNLDSVLRKTQGLLRCTSFSALLYFVNAIFVFLYFEFLNFKFSFVKSTNITCILKPANAILYLYFIFLHFLGRLNLNPHERMQHYLHCLLAPTFQCNLGTQPCFGINFLKKKTPNCFQPSLPSPL